MRDQMRDEDLVRSRKDAQKRQIDEDAVRRTSKEE